MSLGGKLSSQRSTDSATRSSDHNNFSGHGSRLRKTSLDKFLGEVDSLCLWLPSEFLLLSWGSLQLLEFSQSHFGQDPNYRRAHPLGLEGLPQSPQESSQWASKPLSLRSRLAEYGHKVRVVPLGQVAIGQESGVLEVRILRSAGIIVASPLNLLAINDDELVVHYPSRRGNQPDCGSRLLQLVMQQSLGTLCLGLVHNQGNLDPTLDGVDQALRDVLVCERVARHLDGFHRSGYTSENLLFNSSFGRKEGGDS